MKKPFLLGEIIYHRDVYDYKESLKICGILEDKLLLEGDYSGVGYIIERDWLPIEGASRIYNFSYKEKIRKEALLIKDLNKSFRDDIIFRSMLTMTDAVIQLTEELDK